MMGDQVYMDEDKPDMFADHFDSSPGGAARRWPRSTAPNWSRAPVRQVLANVPTYMVWDDHDIRDGWGSSAGDSPTLAAQHPAGESSQNQRLFRGRARRLLAFPGVPQPPARRRSPASGPSPTTSAHRHRTGSAGRCRSSSAAGAWWCWCWTAAVSATCSAKYPILGAGSGSSSTGVRGLPADADALAVVTSTPIASQDPDGQVQRSFGNRTDDIEAFKRRRRERTVPSRSTADYRRFILAAAGARVRRDGRHAVQSG